MKPTKKLTGYSWCKNRIIQDKIAKLAHEKKTVSEIADEIGQTYYRVRAYLDRNNLPITHKKRKPSVRMLEINQYLQQGYSQKQVAEMLHISQQAVSNLMIRYKSKYADQSVQNAC